MKLIEINEPSVLLVVLMYQERSASCRELLNDPILLDHPVWRRLVSAYAMRIDQLARAIAKRSPRAHKFAGDVLELRHMLLCLGPVRQLLNMDVRKPKAAEKQFGDMLWAGGRSHSFSQATEIIEFGQTAKTRRVDNGYERVINALELRDHKKKSWSEIVDLGLCGCNGQHNETCENNLKSAAYDLRKKLSKYPDLSPSRST